MTTTLHFSTETSAPTGATTTILIGSKTHLTASSFQTQLPSQAAPLWEALLEQLNPGDDGDSIATWLAAPTPHQLVVIALPEIISRHNSPSTPHALTQLLRSHAPKEGIADIVISLGHAEHALSSSCAVARAFPVYSRKTPTSDKTLTVHTRLLAREGTIKNLHTIGYAAESVRLASRLVDMPTSELHTDTFLAEAKQVAEQVGASLQVIRGEELRDQGFGGLWNVGRTANHPPALVMLSHDPKDATETIVWVGKGIVYDTGGLSIKTKTGMPGMKVDMAGAAAVLGAFAAAVRAGFNQRLHVLLCLAENAVGANSYRPDDILSMYSGRTVEVNNTDAEGRLVLADGVAYATKHLNPQTIVDLATLTGAQLISTGRRHAAIVCNDDALEAKACKAGRLSGDLVHPLPYCPEFFRAEFKSKVADMKNSVKDRLNAQSSCAGQFIAEHLVEYQGAWLHIDIAGPSDEAERGTGFGVALLLTIFAEHLD